MFVFHNPSMCLPDYSSPVRMLTCRNQKQACSWFEKPCWEKEISWCPFQIPINPLCPPQSPKNTYSPPSTLPFLFCMYFFFSFLACFASMWGAQQSICLGGLQMCSETKWRCSTFTLLCFNCFFNSMEVNGLACMYMTWRAHDPVALCDVLGMRTYWVAH